jgi:hypothetical protein
MATDQATADYEHEQEKREALEDDWADWVECEMPQSSNEPLLPVCDQCVNWQSPRLLHLADGSTQTTPGFCAARTDDDLSQMTQDYAADCRFYEEYIPF